MKVTILNHGWLFIVIGLLLSSSCFARSSLATEKPIYRITANPDRHLAVVQLNDGSVWKVRVDGAHDNGLALEAWPTTAPGGTETLPMALSQYGYGGDVSETASGLQLAVPCSTFGLCVMGDEVSTHLLCCFSMPVYSKQTIFFALILYFGRCSKAIHWPKSILCNLCSIDHVGSPY